MKTHKELLTELIEAVYALHISPTIKEVHDMQMKAAEIRGQMMATKPLQNETTSTQPDEDGWIENTTGRKPNCGVVALRFAQNYITPHDTVDVKWDTMHNNGYAITHYKPA